MCAYLVAAGCLAILTFIFFYLWQPKYHLPPGPWQLPIIGNLHQLGTDSHLTFIQMSKKYGPLLYIRVGAIRFVVVNDLAIAKEVLVHRGKQFADRVETYTLAVVTRDKQDIVFSDYNEAWKVHRKIAHAALHMFGDGMQKLERKILNGVNKVCHGIDVNITKSIDISDSVDFAVFNILCDLIFGHAYEEDDPEYKRLSAMFHFYLHGMQPFLISDYVPLAKYVTWISEAKLIAKLIQTTRERDEIFEEKFREMKSKFKGGQPTNFVEALLQASIENSTGKQGPAETLCHDRLIMSMFDLFVAGSETTSTSIKWAILYLTVWPKVQEKIYTELKDVVGEPCPTLSVLLKHREQLPYTEAAIMEVLRMSSVLYLALGHRATQDTKLNSYNIPKGTFVILNLWAIHHDPKLWKDPFDFQPERFLDSEGKVIRERNRAFLPFSAGPRSCLGESLAKAMLFLFIANLVHQYTFSTAPELPHPDLKGNSKLVLGPKRYKVAVQKRY